MLAPFGCTPKRKEVTPEEARAIAKEAYVYITRSN